MNPEALNGTVVGSCVIQQMIARGKLAAVFRAQQSASSQSVALKVLLPPAALLPAQRILFLQRFRQTMALVSSLEHACILPVSEYGDREGVAYLIMPYRSDTTLQNVLAKEGQLSWPTLLHYLDQIAAAIDYAHEHAVTHRNLHPANVFLATDGKLVVTDFGLVNIAADGLSPQELLVGTSGPCIEPHYIAPEQVLGEPVDGRADLYSLAVILYQMVTGKTPFQGTTPVYIAAQHVQLSPPSPRTSRPDLPLAAEQVIIRAMAKLPSERYTRAQELAEAFRNALATASLSFPAPERKSPPASADNKAPSPAQTNLPTTGAIPLWSKRLRSEQKPVGLRSGNDMMPSPTSPVKSAVASAFPATPSAPSTVPSPALTRKLFNTSEIQQLPGSTTGTQSALSRPQGPLSPFPTVGNTGNIANTDALRITSEQNAAATTVKLTDPMKIVQVPIAGQPGRYVTGFLPAVPPSTPEKPASYPTFVENVLTTLKSDPKKRLKIVGSALLVTAILLSSCIALLIHARTNQPGQVNAHRIAATPNILGTASAQATAAAEANIILTDPLSENIHNWHVALTGSKQYFFSGGAYHIFDDDNSQSAPSILGGETIVGPMAYTLTMEEIKGNDTSLNNSFGLIFRFTTYKKGNQAITTFYTFEVVNMKGGQYQFWKYDSSQASPWIPLWKHSFGKEFFWGHGPHSINRLSVFADGKSFTFTVNDTVVGTAQDSSIASGAIGMLVNLKGTEVAFSNLLLTHH